MWNGRLARGGFPTKLLAELRHNGLTKKVSSRTAVEGKTVLTVFI